MIAALVDAGLAFQQPSWIDLARNAFDFIAACDDPRGTAESAPRSFFPRRAAAVAGHGIGPCQHDARGSGARRGRRRSARERRLGPATIFVARRTMGGNSRSPSPRSAAGVLATAADNSRDVVIRTISTGDDAIPNANAVYACALIRMAALTGDQTWRQRADRLIAAVAPRALAQADRHAALMNALDFRLRGVEICIVGPQPQALLAAALSRAVSQQDRAGARSAKPGAERRSPLAEEVRRPRTQAAAFICAGERCSLPVTEASEIALRVREMAAGHS